MRVLVTGASGFVGRALLDHLLPSAAVQLRAAVRRCAPELHANIEQTLVEELGPNTNWGSALLDVNAVVHAAARVHVIGERAKDPLVAFRRTNVDGTLALAKQAAQAGVRRFIFISSIKVNGEGTPRDRSYTSESFPQPVDPYGASKLEAEFALRNLENKSGMEVVIIRPPLVYGPGVKANFLTLMGMVNRGVPLPFGLVNNRRSLVYVGNLVSAIECCLTHGRAAGRTYMVADSETVSTGDLLRIVANALGRPARLFPVPATILRLAGAMLGRGDTLNKLLGSLTIDSVPIRDELGWRPPYSLQEGVELTARWYLQSRGRF